MSENYANWSSKELKEALKASGIDIAGIFEKEDLISLAQKHNLTKKPTKAGAYAAGAIKEESQGAAEFCSSEISQPNLGAHALGSMINESPPSPGYIPKAERPHKSISKDNLFKLLSQLEAVGRDEHGKLTSHLIASLFKGEKYHPDFKNEKFHPIDRFSHLFSESEPDVAITYTWNMCLWTQLPEFIQNFEAQIGTDIILKYWIDVLFNDQNDTASMHIALKRAEDTYRNARWHAIFLAHNVLARGWCLFEAGVRTLAAMIKFGLNVSTMGEFIRREDPAFSQVVVHPSITNFETDVFSGYDRFNGMRTSKPDDLYQIQESLKQVFGSENKFNEVMHDFVRAATENFIKRNARFLRNSLSKLRSTVAPSAAEIRAYDQKVEDAIMLQDQFQRMLDRPTLSERKLILGIDIGTSKSRACVFRNGKVEVIPNSSGDPSTLTWVSFTESGRLFGDLAKQHAARNPENTIFNFKPLMGRTMDDAAIQEFKLNCPYKIFCGEDNRPRVEVEFFSEKRIFSAEELYAMMLIKIKEDAEIYLQEPVEHVVLAVPSSFTLFQRQALKYAASISGLVVDRIMTEAGAAALFRSHVLLPSQCPAETVLIVDLGCSACNLCVATIDHGVVEILAEAHSAELGGEMFTQLLIAQCLRALKKKYMIDGKLQPRSLHVIRSMCEMAKVQLTSAKEAFVFLENLEEHMSLELRVSRDDFESLNAANKKTLTKLIEKVLTYVDHNGVTSRHEVNALLMVGSASRMPWVRETLQGFFKGMNPTFFSDPETAVAAGACVQGAVFIHDTSFLLIDAVHHPLGIETSGGVFTAIVKSGQLYPCKETKKFITSSDGQSAIGIRLFEGVNPSSPAKENLFLGECTLILQRDARAAASSAVIDVMLDVQTNQVKIVATDTGTGGCVTEVLTLGEQKPEKYHPADVPSIYFEPGSEQAKAQAAPGNVGKTKPPSGQTAKQELQAAVSERAAAGWQSSESSDEASKVRRKSSDDDAKAERRIVAAAAARKPAPVATQSSCLCLVS